MEYVQAGGVRKRRMDPANKGVARRASDLIDVDDGGTNPTDIRAQEFEATNVIEDAEVAEEEADG